MKNLVLFLFTVCFSTTLIAQDCNCQQELDFYYQASQNLISYKDQIKGKKEKAYQAKYQALRQKIDGNESPFDCFVLLNELAFLIRDEHARLRMNGLDFTKEDLKDTEKIAEMKASAYYQRFPKININPDSLKTILTTKPASSVEGIYSRNSLEMGICFDETKGVYQGVILQSSTPIWEPGHLVLYMIPNGHQRFQAYMTNLINKKWYAIGHESYANGQLMISGWKKSDTLPLYHRAPEGEMYSYQTIDQNTSYLRLGTFSMGSKNRQQAKAFYEQLKQQKFQPGTLIVDMRDNGGGGDKVSNPFRKMIRKHARKHQVYILVNQRTGSNGEITSMRLRKYPNITIAGQPTRGVMAYGTNYGTVITSPSNLFYHTLTDMNFSKYIPYETKGIPVDITLALDRDWMEQILEREQQGNQESEVVAELRSHK